MESEHMGILSKFVGTHSEREVKRVLPIVDKIESLEPDFEKLSDEELRDKTREFKSRLAGGETLDDILPEAYAAVREAAKRTIGMRHYRVQLIGGVGVKIEFAESGPSLQDMSKTRRTRTICWWIRKPPTWYGASSKWRRVVQKHGR